MKNSTEQLIHDFRVAMRVKENRVVHWQAINGDTRGKARIRNISESGMLLQTRSDFKPYDHCVFSFDADMGMKNYIPQTGRLVWSRRNTLSPDGHDCGVQFIEPSDFVRERLQRRVDRGVYRQKIRKVAGKISGVFLILAFFCLTAFALWLQQDVVRNVKATSVQMLAVADQQAGLYRHVGAKYLQSQADLLAANQELSIIRKDFLENQGMLKSVSNELSVIKVVLAETQAALARSKENFTVLTDVAETEIRSRQSEFETAMALLTEKNQQLVKELKNLDQQLLFSVGNVQTQEEAEQWLETYRTRMLKIKQKINHFRRQAKNIRLDAQKEMDRIKMVLGNNGYFMKNGNTVVVDQVKYDSVTAHNLDNILNSSVSSVGNPEQIAPRKVDINVGFFK